MLNIFKAPRALWGINVSYFLEGLVYFGVLTVLGKYMSEDVGLSDEWAGLVYSFFTAGITLAMLFLGGVGDKIGVRKALILALSLMVVGRLILAASSMENVFAQGEGLGSPMFWCMAVGLFIVVIGYGTYQPASYAGVKQFTSKKTSSMGYAVIYGLMNLGAFVSGLLSPPIRQQFGIGAVYWIFDVITFAAVLAVIFILTKKTVEVTTARVKAEDAAETAGDPQEDKQEANKSDDPPLPEWTGGLRIVFYASILLILVCVGGFVYSYSTSPETPAEQKVTALEDEYKNLLKAASEIQVKKSPTESDRQALDGALVELSSKLNEIAAISRNTVDQVKAPEDFNGLIDEQGLAIFKAILDRQGRLNETLKSNLDTIHLLDLDADTRLSLKTLWRSHGIYTMTLAYSMVADVNAEVVTRLRKRFKKPGEDIIPMTEDIASAAVETAGLPALGKFKGYSAAISRAVDEFTALDSSGALAPVIDMLRSDQALALEFAGILESEAGPIATKIITSKMLTDAEFALEMGDEFSDVQGEADLFTAIGEWLSGTLSDLFGSVEGEESAGSSNLTFLIATIEMTEKDTAEILENFNSVFFVPIGDRLPGWTTRYVPWGVGILLFLFLFMKIFLRQRPDHPFNNFRFVYFIFILIPVQTLFAHNWLTLPYYINRAFGGTKVGDWFELFSNLNPLLIFFLAPLVAAFTARANVFKMMIFGTLVMAAPTFLLALPPNPWFFITYIIIMSIGEAIWQPRFLQYVAELAPEGKTGIYMGIAQFPWFLTKMVTGFYSGWFLSQYCPRVGPQDTQTLWFIYALIAMISPVCLWITGRWIQKGMKSMEERGAK